MPKLKIVRWRKIRGFTNSYAVSDFTKIRSLPRIITKSNGVRQPIAGRIMKTEPGDNRDFYPIVAIRKGGMYHYRYVHILVWQAFNGLIPPGLEINHKDGNKKNSKLDNLELVTHKENMEHAARLGLMGRPPTYDSETIQKVLKAKGPQKSIAERFGISPSYVSKLKRYKARRTSYLT